jgi:hypothetical protein
MTGIVFNESALRDIKKTVSRDRADFRFGFVVWRQYDADLGEWLMDAGFLVGSRAIAREAFLPNLTERPKAVASKLRDWLEPCKNDGILYFNQKIILISCGTDPTTTSISKWN